MDVAMNRISLVFSLFILLALSFMLTGCGGGGGGHKIVVKANGSGTSSDETVLEGVGSDGPLAAAKVYLASSKQGKLSTEALTDENGRYRLHIPNSILRSLDDDDLPYIHLSSTSQTRVKIATSQLQRSLVDGQIEFRSLLTTSQLKAMAEDESLSEIDTEVEKYGGETLKELSRGLYLSHVSNAKTMVVESKMRALGILSEGEKLNAELSQTKTFSSTILIEVTDQIETVNMALEDSSSDESKNVLMLAAATKEIVEHSNADLIIDDGSVTGGINLTNSPQILAQMAIQPVTFSQGFSNVLSQRIDEVKTDLENDLKDTLPPEAKTAIGEVTKAAVEEVSRKDFRTPEDLLAHHMIRCPDDKIPSNKITAILTYTASALSPPSGYPNLIPRIVVPPIVGGPVIPDPPQEIESIPFEPNLVPFGDSSMGRVSASPFATGPVNDADKRKFRLVQIDISPTVQELRYFDVNSVPRMVFTIDKDRKTLLNLTSLDGVALNVPIGQLKRGNNDLVPGVNLSLTGISAGFEGSKILSKGRYYTLEVSKQNQNWTLVLGSTNNEQTAKFSMGVVGFQGIFDSETFYLLSEAQIKSIKFPAEQDSIEEVLNKARQETPDGLKAAHKIAKKLLTHTSQTTKLEAHLIYAVTNLAIHLCDNLNPTVSLAQLLDKLNISRSGRNIFNLILKIIKGQAGQLVLDDLKGFSDFQHYFSKAPDSMIIVLKESIETLLKIERLLPVDATDEYVIMTFDWNSTTIKFQKKDLYLLKSVFRLLKFIMHFLSAYNLDISDSATQDLIAQYCKSADSRPTSPSPNTTPSIGIGNSANVSIAKASSLLPELDNPFDIQTFEQAVEYYTRSDVVDPKCMLVDILKADSNFLTLINKEHLRNSKEVIIETLHYILLFYQSIEILGGGQSGSAFYVKAEDIEEIKEWKKRLLSIYNNITRSYHRTITVDGVGGKDWYSIGNSETTSFYFNYRSSHRNSNLIFDYTYIYDFTDFIVSRCTTFNNCNDVNIREVGFYKIDLTYFFEWSFREIIEGGTIPISSIDNDTMIKDSHIHYDGTITQIVDLILPGSRIIHIDGRRYIIIKSIKAVERSGGFEVDGFFDLNSTAFYEITSGFRSVINLPKEVSRYRLYKSYSKIESIEQVSVSSSGIARFRADYTGDIKLVVHYSGNGDFDYGPHDKIFECDGHHFHVLSFLNFSMGGCTISTKDLEKWLGIYNKIVTPENNAESIIGTSLKIAWQKKFGGNLIDYATSVIATADGGYLVVGFTESTDLEGYSGEGDALIIKVSSSGDVVWQKVLGGSLFDEARSAVENSDGTFYVGGSTRSIDGDLDGQNNQGDTDKWLLKLDQFGNIIWQKTFGGSGKDTVESIDLTKDENLILVGSTVPRVTNTVNCPTSNAEDVSITKVDSLGTIQWQKNFGGSCRDFSQSIKQTNDGGYIFAGYTESTDGDLISRTTTGKVPWIVKLDDAGTIVWQKIFSDYVGGSFEQIELPFDDGYILIGNVNGVDGDYILVMRLDLKGEVIWQNTYIKNQSLYATAIQQLMDGSFIVAGYTKLTGELSIESETSQMWLINITSSGELLWQKPLIDGIWSKAYAVARSLVGGFIVIGSSGYPPDSNVPEGEDPSSVSAVKYDESTSCVSTDEILTNFNKFGPSEWGPDEFGQLQSKDNANFSGIYSDIQQTSYSLQANLHSTNSDDDTIALIAAATEDQNKQLHVIAVVRAGNGNGNRAGLNGIYWGIVYLRMNNGEIEERRTLVDGESNLITSQGSWSDYSGGTTISITKSATGITAIASPLSADSTSALESSSRLELDWGSDPVLARFGGSTYYGFAAHSQPLASFRNIVVDNSVSCN